MIEIKDLLARFEKILLPKEEKIESVRAIVSEAIGVDLKKEEVSIKNNTVYLNIKPIYKNEVLLKQEKILLRLEEAFGAGSPKDIR